MIARSHVVLTQTPRGRPRFGLGWLFAVHLAADAVTARALTSSLGVQEFDLLFSLFLGLAWGQATLLGQFLIFAEVRQFAWRTFIMAAWFGLMAVLGGRAFRAIGSPSGIFGNCIFVGAPLVCSAIIALMIAARGGRILGQAAGARRVDGHVFQFSLRHLFKLTLFAAVVLAVIRTVVEAFEDSAWRVLVFGFPPLANVLGFQPLLIAWAALGDRHPGWRTAAVLSLAMVSAFVPVLIRGASPMTSWIIACPVVVQSLVAMASLWIARLLGFRLAFDESLVIPTGFWLFPPR